MRKDVLLGGQLLIWLTCCINAPSLLVAPLGAQPVAKHRCKNFHPIISAIFKLQVNQWIHMNINISQLHHISTERIGISVASCGKVRASEWGDRKRTIYGSDGWKRKGRSIAHLSKAGKGSNDRIDKSGIRNKSLCSGSKKLAFDPTLSTLFVASPRYIVMMSLKDL